MMKARLTQSAPDWRDFAAFSGFIYAQAESCSQAESTPARQQRTQTVWQFHTRLLRNIPWIEFSAKSYKNHPLAQHYSCLFNHSVLDAMV